MRAIWKPYKVTSSLDHKVETDIWRQSRKSYSGLVCKSMCRAHYRHFPGYSIFYRTLSENRKSELSLFLYFASRICCCQERLYCVRSATGNWPLDLTILCTCTNLSLIWVLLPRKVWTFPWVKTPAMHRMAADAVAGTIWRWSICKINLNTRLDLENIHWVILLPHLEPEKNDILAWPMDKCGWKNIFPGQSISAWAGIFCTTFSTIVNSTRDCFLFLSCLVYDFWNTGEHRKRMRLVEEDVSDLPANGIASIISQSNYLQSTVKSDRLHWNPSPTNDRRTGIFHLSEVQPSGREDDDSDLCKCTPREFTIAVVWLWIPWHFLCVTHRKLCIHPNPISVEGCLDDRRQYHSRYPSYPFRFSEN